MQSAHNKTLQDIILDINASVMAPYKDEKDRAKKSAIEKLAAIYPKSNAALIQSYYDQIANSIYELIMLITTPGNYCNPNKATDIIEAMKIPNDLKRALFNYNFSSSALQVPLLYVALDRYDTKLANKLHNQHGADPNNVVTLRRISESPIPMMNALFLSRSPYTKMKEVIHLAWEWGIRAQTGREKWREYYKDKDVFGCGLMIYERITQRYLNDITPYDRLIRVYKNLHIFLLVHLDNELNTMAHEISEKIDRLTNLIDTAEELERRSKANPLSDKDKTAYLEKIKSFNIDLQVEAIAIRNYFQQLEQHFNGGLLASASSLFKNSDWEAFKSDMQKHELLNLTNPKNAAPAATTTAAAESTTAASVTTSTAAATAAEAPSYKAKK